MSDIPVPKESPLAKLASECGHPKDKSEGNGGCYDPTQHFGWSCDGEGDHASWCDKDCDELFLLVEDCTGLVLSDADQEAIAERRGYSLEELHAMKPGAYLSIQGDSVTVEQMLDLMSRVATLQAQNAALKGEVNDARTGRAVAEAASKVSPEEWIETQAQNAAMKASLERIQTNTHADPNDPDEVQEVLTLIRDDCLAALNESAEPVPSLSSTPRGDGSE